jgi:hypothetical protein
MKKALFVDLANFYSSLIRSGIGKPRELRDYFLYWLDFDLLANWLTGEFVPTWIFYSGRRLGAKSERIEHELLSRYADRINRLIGVTAYDVEIPGEQRESFTVNCAQCGESKSVRWESEKGVDAALIVHLFDTQVSWDHAFLLSGDADFSPAVRSLRRGGKIVSGAGVAASPTLLRELNDFTDLTDLFLRSDFAAYRLFGPGGVVERWLTDPIAFDKIKHEPLLHVTTIVKWAANDSSSGLKYQDGKPLIVERASSVLLEDKGIFDLKERTELLDAFANEFPQLTWSERHLLLPRPGWSSAERRLPELVTRFHGNMAGGGGIIEVVFDKTPDGKSWQSANPNEPAPQ